MTGEVRGAFYLVAHSLALSIERFCVATTFWKMTTNVTSTSNDMRTDTLSS